MENTDKKEILLKKIDSLGENLSITIRGHLAFKCYSTYSPEWYSGLTIIGDRVTCSGNEQHSHASENQKIYDYRISSDSIKKIKEAIKQILENE